MVRLGCRESDEVGVWVVWVTGKNWLYLLQIWLGTHFLFRFSIHLRCVSSSCGQIRVTEHNEVGVLVVWVTGKNWFYLIQIVLIFIWHSLYLVHLSAQPIALNGQTVNVNAVMALVARPIPDFHHPGGAIFVNGRAMNMVTRSRYGQKVISNMTRDVLDARNLTSRNSKLFELAFHYINLTYP